MKRSAYSIITIPLLLSVLVIAIAFYSVGVVEKNIASSEADEHLSTVITNIYENNSTAEAMTEKLCSEYELKAQTLSVLISQLPGTMIEDMTAEELRITSGADSIEISDKDGLIIFSTAPDTEIRYINEEFREGLSQKNYCRTIISKSDTGCVFETAVSRRNNGGLIVAYFSSSALNEVLNYNGSSYVIHKSSSFIPGTTAIIDLESNSFIAHTNASLIGTECIIEQEHFRTDKKMFSHRFHREPSFVFYKYYNESTVAISIVPKNHVYTNRTIIVTWLIILAAIIITSTLLAIRHYNTVIKNCNIQKKEENP
jgi:hypothetical protein